MDVKIKVLSKEHSYKIQKYIFSQGYSWSDGTQKLRYTHEYKWLVIQDSELFWSAEEPTGCGDPKCPNCGEGHLTATLEELKETLPPYAPQLHDKQQKERVDKETDGHIRKGAKLAEELVDAFEQVGVHVGLVMRHGTAYSYQAQKRGQAVTVHGDFSQLDGGIAMLIGALEAVNTAADENDHIGPLRNLADDLHQIVENYAGVLYGGPEREGGV